MNLCKRQISIKGAKLLVSFKDWWPWWPAIGVFLLLTSCMSHNGESMDKEIEHKDEGFNIKTLDRKAIEYTDEGFSIKIPAGVEVEKESPLGESGDFHLYHFSIGEEYFLSAYIGNAASFCNIDPEDTKITTGSIKTGLVNNMLFKRAELRGLNDHKRVEVLFRFPSNQWPSYMHFIYEDIPFNLESLAEEIIDSLKEK